MWLRNLKQEWNDSFNLEAAMLFQLKAILFQYKDIFPIHIPTICHAFYSVININALRTIQIFLP